MKSPSILLISTVPDDASLYIAPPPEEDNSFTKILPIKSPVILPIYAFVPPLYIAPPEVE